MWSYISRPLTGGEAEQFLSVCDVVTAQNMFSEITQDRELHQDHRGEEKKTTFYLSVLPGTEPGASCTEASFHYWSRSGMRHKTAGRCLRSVRRTVCVSLEGPCVWVSACKSRSVLPRSVYLSSPPFAISFTISSQGRAQRSSENQYSVGFCSLNWEDPCFMCPDVSNWDINKKVNKIDVEISTVYI